MNALADALFWTDLKERFLDKIDHFDVRVIGRLVRDYSYLVPPLWLITAACRRLPRELDAEGLLQLSAIGYALHSHPQELPRIATAMLTTLRSDRDPLGGLVAATLINVRDASTPASPFRATQRGVAGSVVVFDSHKCSMYVVLSTLGTVGPKLRKRALHTHVAIHVSDSSLVVEIDLQRLMDYRPRRVACRLAVESMGTCDAEEWFVRDHPDDGGRIYRFAAGEGRRPRLTPPLPDAMDGRGGAALRVDCFYGCDAEAYVFPKFSAL
jgi:hypothetical protein